MTRTIFSLRPSLGLGSRTPKGTRPSTLTPRFQSDPTPLNEPQAGQEVSMQLLSETAVNVRVGSPTASSRVGHRPARKDREFPALEVRPRAAPEQNRLFDRI